MFTAEIIGIRRVANDESVADPSTATFEVHFKERNPRLRETERRHDGASHSLISVALYEVTRHGDTAYSIISNRTSQVDSMPMGFIVTTSNEGYSVTRILRGFENIELKYTVSRTPNPLFFNVPTTELARLSLKIYQQCEEEAIEAFKVGLLVNELEWVDWDAIHMVTEDDLGEWVHVDELTGHSLDAWNGWSLVESARKDIY